MESKNTSRRIQIEETTVVIEGLEAALAAIAHAADRATAKLRRPMSDAARASAVARRDDLRADYDAIRTVVERYRS